MYDYIKDPLEIEVESFRLIRELTALDQYDEAQQQLVMRLVHTCGDPAVVDDLVMSANAVAVGQQCAADQAHSAVICDVEMVRHGITRRYQEEPPKCFLIDDQTTALAQSRGETRSMAAVELWRPYLANSVVIIGNAPTALFRLLEILHSESVRPALIIGMPVGFVGAAESKEALIDFANTHQQPFMTLRGRRGGSALASSAWNALLRLSRGIRF
ncbi:MAG: precorrin-8X methylmutase [Pseudomonadales bacterium]|uniref:Precorrin isomerase n=1 Tax=Oleiphilus messinensis TaxID=141451 RepID=A0A1Y0IBH0_9GAMM|nr:precorrin-8X methylmutase [Oleiphilus messinensis]ARU56805.1 precorrin isomerase [Oleiphilus messinensis]MCG8610774.1 precorrin-8X methylmutase [Pseudomonadales bacterium]